jgi:hypothetical protein
MTAHRKLDASKHYPLVLVHWLDAVSQDEWQPVREALADKEPRLCHSIGWLLYRDSRKVVIGNTLGDASSADDFDVGNHLIIPVPWIHGKIVILKEPK